MNKKGISPIIAFVMLMALAVTLGAFVTIWYTNSTESQTKAIVEKLGTEQECMDVRFDVSFDYDPADGCGALVYNLGNFNIDKLKVDKVISGLGTSEIIDMVIKPKEGVLWTTEPLGDFALLEKLQFSPIISEGGALTQCLNERAFIPNGSKSGCA